MQNGVCYLPAFHCKIQIRRAAVKTLLQEQMALVLLVAKWMHLCSANLDQISLGDNSERSGKLLPERLSILHVVCFEYIHEDEICHIIKL